MAPQNAVLIHTYFQNLPHPTPLGNFVPSAPPPVNKSWLHHCHWRSYKGVQGPNAAPPPIDWPERLNKKKLMCKQFPTIPQLGRFAPSLWPPVEKSWLCQSSSFVSIISEFSHMFGQALAQWRAFSLAVDRSSRLHMPVIILFMFALYISRYLSVRNTHFP